MSYLFIISFTLLWVLFHKYQFLDLKNKRNTKWKMYRVLLTAHCGILTYIAYPNFYDVFLASSISWWLFEIGVNVIALNTKPFYVGESSIFENKFGKIKWIVMAILLLTSLILKLWIQ